VPEHPPLPRSVRALGTASLLNDASSEFLYPFLPVFLTTVVGVGKPLLGLIEGLAESVAVLSKFAAGPLAVRLRRRKPLIVLGYAAAAVSRPILALSTAPAAALLLRSFDRVGKGLRGPPRDALIAADTPPDQRGRAFGFRASMDHLGAVVGALLAGAAGWLLLDGAGDPEARLRLLFLLGSIPAFLSVVVIVLWVRDVPPEASPSVPAGPLPVPFRRYLLAAGVFALGNGSDAFLLLRVQEMGIPLAWLPALWAAHHAVKSVLAAAVGRRTDRTGRRGAILLGWGAYAAVYAGFALATGPVAAVALFLAYGLYHGFAEGVEKALVADLVPPALRDRAFSVFAGVTGAAALPASLAVGILWESFGPGAALGTGAALALGGALLLLRVPDRGAIGAPGGENG
jgi:MFS family permease